MYIYVYFKIAKKTLTGIMQVCESWVPSQFESAHEQGDYNWKTRSMYHSKKKKEYVESI